MLRHEEGAFPYSSCPWQICASAGGRCTDAPVSMAGVPEAWPVGCCLSSPGREALLQAAMGLALVAEAWPWLSLPGRAEHGSIPSPQDRLCWHLQGGWAGSRLLFPAHTQGVSCTKWHQGSLFSSDATFVTCYRVNCDKIDWSSPGSDCVLRWLLWVWQTGTEPCRAAGSSTVMEQGASC